MDFRELVRKTRSYRRFDEKKKVSLDEMKDIVASAALAPSAANLQPLVYRIVTDKDVCKKIFPTLHWASALYDWEGPAPGERPTAYIIVAQNMNISKRIWLDPGIAAVSAMYAAVDKGLGGCIIASIDKVRLSSVLKLPARYSIQLVLAIGVPIEEVSIETMKNSTESITYYRTEEGVHHVPKRALKDILI